VSAVNSAALLASAGDDGYQISRSVRLRSSASAYFNRTPSTATNRKTWTWSGWVKRGNLGATSYSLFAAGPASNTDFFYFGFEYSGNADQLVVIDYPGGSSLDLRTTPVFRDPSGWYHVVLAVDTTQATSSNRAKIYVNGVQVTAFGSATYPSQNTDTRVNSTNVHYVGAARFASSPVYPYDGYMAETNFIDGQALTPSSFGETDAVTGVWKPKKYAGTYGTNGFYLNFSDNSNNTATTIGKDSSGNGNNWTPNNISVTAGVTYDSMLDVPTMWADGGNGRGNYCVLNSLNRSSQISGNISQANLYVVNGSSWPGVGGTIAVNSGKWYYECTVTGHTTNSSGVVGWCFAAQPQDSDVSNYFAQQGGFFIRNDVAGAKQKALTFGGTTIDLLTPAYANGVLQFAVDFDTGKMWIGKDGSWITGDPSTGSTPAFSFTVNPAGYVPFISPARSDIAQQTYTANFGQRPFAYTPPTGFKSLNTQNLPDATIKKGNAYFDVSLYTGNHSTNVITNSGGFQPDFIWLKDRSAVAAHVLFDSVRGVGGFLSTNNTTAEDTTQNYAKLNSFNSNGFTLGAATLANDLPNYSGDSFVGWQWKESVSAGFDIVTYTGNGATSSTRTIAHSLGVTPAFIITKKRSGGTDYGWSCWHKDLGGNYGIWLDKTSARNSGMWAGYSSFSSTVFTPPDLSYGNENGATYVNYLFSEVAGYSKFGSYTGNGSTDGPFVYLGFKPRFLMIKATSAAGYNWTIEDSARSTFNASDKTLYPSLSNAENSGTARSDFLSNGFKARDSSNNNVSGVTYIYAAFAENPFKNSLAR
jgi:hypothetical protein